MYLYVEFKVSHSHPTAQLTDSVLDSGVSLCPIFAVRNWEDPFVCGFFFIQIFVSFHFCWSTNFWSIIDIPFARQILSSLIFRFNSVYFFFFAVSFGESLNEAIILFEMQIRFFFDDCFRLNFDLVKKNWKRCKKNIRFVLRHFKI